MPAQETASAAKTMTADQIAAKYGSSVVRITTPPMSPSATGEDTRTPIVGSGFMATKTGLIVTSLGVVQGQGINAPGTVTVEYALPTGEYGKANGRVLFHDESAGIALIKVDPQKVALKPLPLGDSGAIEKGDTVVALAAQSEMSILRATGRVTGLEEGVEEGNFRQQAHRRVLRRHQVP